MKKFPIAGSGLAAVAAAGSAGAVDVTLGGSIEMGIEYGLGKKHDGFTFTGSSAYQDIVINISAAGTTDAGLKFGGSFSINSAEELKLNLYEDANDSDERNLVKLVNTSATAGIKAAAYNVSGGRKVAAGSIVSVKINSAWQGAKSKLTAYAFDVDDIAADSAICKIAGRLATVAAAANQTLERATADKGTKVASTASEGLVNGYLPAGQLADLDLGNPGEFQLLELTANTSNGAANIPVFLDGADSVADSDDAGNGLGNALDGDKFDIGIANVAATAAPAHDAFSGEAADVRVNSATVFAGPYAEVKMTSSTTKMVVGAVCVTNEMKDSKTAAYLDPASRILEVSNASIFLEGGFGKLTLQQGDYKGKVAAIGSAGDQATITSSGLVAILEGASFMGMSGYGAVDVGSIEMGKRPNYMLGTSVDLMGLTVAMKMEDIKDDTGYIDTWDMGTSYAIGDLAMDFVLDSAGDWAVSASASVAGFTASSVIENISKGASKKAGLSIDTTLAADFNGISVSIGLDEEMDYTIGGSYALGNSGLAITTSYASGDNGGKIAAKMSF